MASLYGIVSKETCDVIEYLRGEYDAGTMPRPDVERQIASAVKDEPKLLGAGEYFAWYCVAIAKEIVYPPYGVECADGKIRKKFKFLGLSTAEEEASRTGADHEGCPGGQHKSGVWKIEDLTETAPAV